MTATNTKLAMVTETQHHHVKSAYKNLAFSVFQFYKIFFFFSLKFQEAVTKILNNWLRTGTK